MDVIELDQIIQRSIGGNWQITAPYTRYAPINTAPGVTPVGGSAYVRTSILSDQLGAGTGLIITHAQLYLLNAVGQDYALFTIEANGSAVPGYESIVGNYDGKWIDTFAIIQPGAFWEIPCYNYSGSDSTFNNFPDKVDARVKCWARGYLFSQTGTSAAKPGANLDALIANPPQDPGFPALNFNPFKFGAAGERGNGL